MSLTNSPFWFASGAAASGGGFYPYSIDQSLRFNAADSAYLSRTPSSTSNQKTWTFNTWIKLGNMPVASGSFATGSIFSAGGGVFNKRVDVKFHTNDNFYIIIDQRLDGGTYYTLQSIDSFRDVSGWYMFTIIVDTTESTAADRIRMYVNGTRLTNLTNTNGYPAQNSDLYVNTSGLAHYIGETHHDSADYRLDAYLAEVNFIDGTALDPTSFGETINGVWVPKAYDTADGAYGTNGFYLPFDDSAAIGDDESGNTNDWTANNLAASDVMTDSPTNNFCTLNVLNKDAEMISEQGSLKVGWSVSGNYHGTFGSTYALNSGKWYWEVRVNTSRTDSETVGIMQSGISLLDKGQMAYGQSAVPSYAWAIHEATKYKDAASGGSYGTAANSASDIIGVALDLSSNPGSITMYKNGVSIGVMYSDIDTDYEWVPAVSGYGGGTQTGLFMNFGQDSTFAGAISAGGNADDNGIGDFAYAPPSGFLSLCSANLPEPAIGPQQASGQQSDDYFETMLYTGNGAVQHIGSGGAQHPIDVTTVTNSIRFNDDDSPELSKAYSTAQTNTKKITISVWVKRSNISNSRSTIIFAKSGGAGRIAFENDNTLLANAFDTGYNGFTSSAVFSDTSAWYHIVYQGDSTQATAGDRNRVWVNGVEQTNANSSSLTPQDSLTNILRNGNTTYIGRDTDSSSYYFDGYLAEMHVIDGSVVAPTEFGQYGSNGYWVPKAVSGLTYGTNGFYLDYSDNSTANALGTDSSGNGNNFSATNVATTDQMGDSPTQNFATLNPNTPGMTGTLSEGNLKVVTQSTGSDPNTQATFGVSSGKWYWEAYLNDTSVHYQIGITKYGMPGYADIGSGEHQVVARAGAGATRIDTTDVETGITAAVAGDIIGFALDMDNKTIQFYNNGSVFGDAVDFSSLSNFKKVTPWIVDTASSITVTAVYNFGADDTFSGNDTGGAGSADGNGYGSFYYTPPTGFLALVDDNIPQEGISNPDWVWIKERSSTSGHALHDSVRGAGKYLGSHSTAAEGTSTTQVTSFDANGFTTGPSGQTNESGQTYAAWTWKAGGKANTFNVDGTGYASMTAAGLTDGSIALSGLSVNTTAGFSIATFTMDTGDNTIAHGLGTEPDLLIFKTRGVGGSWVTWARPFGENTKQNLLLNDTAAVSTPGAGNWIQDITDTLVGIGGYGNMPESGTQVMYAFSSVEGYSKVGSYVGNANADGTFVYTGFRPAWVMTKMITNGSQWTIIDNTRNTYNAVDKGLVANTNAAEVTGSSSATPFVDFTSNGFKIRSSQAQMNQSNDTFIYLAFAEQPFKYANAR